MDAKPTTPEPQPVIIERGNGQSVTWTDTLNTGGEKK